MMGGAGIIGSFLDENEIDEFMIHVIPNFTGEGIPLVQPSPSHSASQTDGDGSILRRGCKTSL